MTQKLYEMLKKEFPKKSDFEQVSLYDNSYERIYLNLLNEKRSDKKFTEYEKVVNIAKNVFDVPFFYGTRGDVNSSFFFEPTNIDSYHQNHFAHHIQVIIPSYMPQITIDTGNRGNFLLHDKQRNNYFKFVKEVYKTFYNAQ